MTIISDLMAHQRTISEDRIELTQQLRTQPKFKTILEDKLKLNAKKFLENEKAINDYLLSK